MNDPLKLTYRERSELEAVRSKASDAKEFQRAQALLLLDEGATVAEIAELLRVTRQTIYNWATRFQTRRTRPVVQRLHDAPRDGRPATGGAIIDELLDELIETDPRHYGYRSTIWTAELFQQYLADYWQIVVSRRSVHYALRRLRVRWKWPRHVLAREDYYWRQAKGGLKVASGNGRARSC